MVYFLQWFVSNPYEVAQDGWNVAVDYIENHTPPFSYGDLTEEYALTLYNSCFVILGDYVIPMFPQLF